MLSKNTKIKKSKWFSLFACLFVSACGGGDQSGRAGIGVLEQPQTALETTVPEKITTITAGGVDYSLSSRSKIWVLPKFPDLKMANGKLLLAGLDAIQKISKISDDGLASQIIFAPKDLKFKVGNTRPKMFLSSGDAFIQVGEMKITAPEAGFILKSISPVVGRIVANIELHDLVGSDPCKSMTTTSSVFSEDSAPVNAVVTGYNAADKTFTVTLSAQVSKEFLNQYKTERVVLGRKTQALGCRNYCSKVRVQEIPRTSLNGTRIGQFSGVYDCNSSGGCGNCSFMSRDCFSVNALTSADQCLSQSVEVSDQKTIEITEEIHEWSVHLDQLDRSFGWTLNGFSGSNGIQVVPGISQVDRAEIKLPLSSVGL